MLTLTLATLECNLLMRKLALLALFATGGYKRYRKKALFIRKFLRSAYIHVTYHVWKKFLLANKLFPLNKTLMTLIMSFIKNFSKSFKNLVQFTKNCYINNFCGHFLIAGLIHA